MYKIKTYNKISKIGLQVFDDKFGLLIFHLFFPSKITFS